MQYALILMCVAAGGLLPAQAAMNAAVGLRASGPLFAVAVNFAVGFAAMSLVLAGLRVAWPTPAQISGIPWWAWCGGLCGTAVVFTTLFAAPRLGAAVVFASIIAGQIGFSLLYDAFGWLNYPQHAVTPGRLLGAALLVAGVIMIRKF